ncbi:MAG: hypothetical protein JEY71_17285 [Sphaerochaeta sp.]|nr:hypothetical protein [Sphaerochaeta sp.]
MARKKIVFVIVEGPSDDEALGVLLHRMYDKNTVHVHITHGDVTTTKGAGSSTILAMLGKILETYMKANHFTKMHFQEIVHIVDMDGAYIPDDVIIEDVSAKKPIYSLTEIRTANVQGIINRNMTKRACINKISSTQRLNDIPYQVYFMSCNLDHVLYDKLNPTDEEKERDSLKFAKKYGSNIPDFVKFISNSSFSIGGSYLGSWSFIKEEKHSLERHTNLGICITRALTG